MRVDQRTWFLNETVKAMKRANGEENHEDRPMVESRAPWHNTPDMRALQGKDARHIPARNIRLGK